MAARALSQSPRRPTGGAQTRLVSLSLLAGAVALGCLALPRAVSGMLVAAHGDTVAGLAAPVTPALSAARARALRAYERAAEWHDGPQVSGNLGALELAAMQRAIAGNDPAAAQAALDAALAAHRRSLAAAPAQPYVWTRLTQADFAAAASDGEAARHLRMALETGPLEPALVTTRLGLAFAMWPALDDGLKAAMNGQIRYAAQFFPMALARQARRHRAQETVMAVLDSDADLLRRFSMAYSRI